MFLLLLYVSLVKIVIVVSAFSWNIRSMNMSTAPVTRADMAQRENLFPLDRERSDNEIIPDLPNISLTMLRIRVGNLQTKTNVMPPL